MRDFRGKKILVRTWNTTIDLILGIKRIWRHTIDFVVTKLLPPPHVKTISETIDKIIRNKCSISRYGDGELKLISGKDISFQKHSTLLEERLKEVLVSDNEGHIVCIPDIFEDNSQYTKSNAKAWKSHLIEYRLKWYKNLNMKKVYFNSLISRCYLCFQDTEKSKYFFENMKKIWNKRNIVIVEGEYSRLGVGNDLFANANHIRRVLCPAKDVFSNYSEILAFVKKLDKEDLILIALGPTASVLAYDLHKEGFQAIDVGHVDVEYEWYLKGAEKAVAIKNKFVNEVKGGDFEEDNLSSKYLSEVIYNFSNESQVVHEV
ncbi:SP_1767 family glycosyltransferase [Bacillus cereus group sp. BfR-BA-01310]|uniref:SP_1767 family glycosyltransferase n=1 Tax=Bacillus cereus group sp. BfR-BA-01310 TaxID=2920287 RepID=UPI001F575311|nr:SP_1767 family glycosyltransferase [Bacillus cereus group sp. BfR-BA-01310]